MKGIGLETRFLLTPPPPPPLTGCRVSTASATLANVDCSNVAAYNSPKWTLNLSSQQMVELGAVKLIFAADRWSLAAFVQNIENQRTPTFMTVTPVTNFLVASTTAPRLYGVRGSVKF